MSPTEHSEHAGGHGGGEKNPVRGLTASDAGMTLRLEPDRLEPGRRTELAFTIDEEDGTPVTDFEIEHERRLHLIVVRRDMRGFQHLHPDMSPEGRWSTPVTIEEPGTYRVFADFTRGGQGRTLARDLVVGDAAASAPFPAIADRTVTTTGYEVELTASPTRAGEEAELEFSVTREAEHVDVEPYLGAAGHLVALREDDLAYLHVHPAGAGHGGHEAGGDGGIRFVTEFPSAARYALFLQFKHEGRVQTAEFGRTVG